MMNSKTNNHKPARSTMYPIIPANTYRSYLLKKVDQRVQEIRKSSNSLTHRIRQVYFRLVKPSKVVKTEALIETYEDIIDKFLITTSYIQTVDQFEMIIHSLRRSGGLTLAGAWNNEHANFAMLAINDMIIACDEVKEGAHLWT